MTLTREQRIEAYTYALFCALAEIDEAWGSLNDWEDYMKLPFIPSEVYKELTRRYRGYSIANSFSALCRAIEQAEKSKT